MGNRPERVADAIRDELSRLLSREVHDPGVGFVTLTGVELSPDLKQARVFVSRLGSEADRASAVEGLNHAATFLRWRPDKPPQDCRYDQLEVTKAYELERVFGARRRDG